MFKTGLLFFLLMVQPMAVRRALVATSVDGSDARDVMRGALLDALGRFGSIEGTSGTLNGAKLKKIRFFL